MVIGAVGQIGSELTMALRRKYGGGNVVAVGHKTRPLDELANSGPFEFADANEPDSIERLIKKYKIDAVHHLAAVLSANAENNPDLAWKINIDGLKNILDLARKYELSRLIIPSSIAVFGPQAPSENTPQETILRPNTIYGVTKVAGELLCDYYCQKFGIDVRGVRLPGLISYKTPPGGGTTDYAVAIYYEAIRHGRYTCFVEDRTILPMMYMPDAIKCLMELQEADGSKLRYRNAYNVTSLSFSVKELADSIRKQIPDFEVTYEPDFRQKIADSWPNSIDDTPAREDWGWKPAYTLDAMTEDMLKNLRIMHEEGKI
ncbi:putative epimerase/dehydratase [subsurface metagenome]